MEPRTPGSEGGPQRPSKELEHPFLHVLVGVPAHLHALDDACAIQYHESGIGEGLILASCELAYIVEHRVALPGLRLKSLELFHVLGTHTDDDQTLVPVIFVERIQGGHG